MNTTSVSDDSLMAIMANNNNMASMALQQPQLWPLGVGLSDRYIEKPGAEDNCSCLCCCSSAAWFYDSEYRRGSESSVDNGCCKWAIKDADILGQKMSFEGRQCCALESCGSNPEVTIQADGVEIGKVVINMPHGCSIPPDGADLLIVTDARGNPKYFRRDNMTRPWFRYSFQDGDACGWQGTRHPVYQAGVEPFDKMRPIATITTRYHAWAPCHPRYVGIEKMPNVPPEDQKLLLGLALAAWWRPGGPGRQTENPAPTPMQ